MKEIVCAIRGGDSCRLAQERAIALSQERQRPIVFVHVVDTDRVSRMETSLAETVLDEMQQIGQSLLSIALERARSRQVDATTVLLKGSVPPRLEEFLRESQPSVLVIGTPGSEGDHNTFSPEAFKQFVDKVQQTLGIEVQVV